MSKATMSVGAIRTHAGWQPRYTIVLACALAMFISYIDRVNISVAALAMQAEFGWSESLKGLILASFFVGYMVMQIVGGWLAHRYHGERVLVVCLVAWSLCTALTPIAAYAWLPLLFAIRIGLGLSEGPLNPAVYSILAVKVPDSERARAVALYASAGFLGTFVALVSTGGLVKAYGWQSAFYVFGAIGLIYALFVGRLLGVGSAARQKPDGGGGLEAPRTTIPWKKLLALKPFWALVFSFFCTSWIYYVLLLWMPSYFAQAHGLQIVRTGIYSLAPWIIMFVVINLGGWLSDAMVKRGVTPTATRKGLTTVGLLGAGCLLVSIQFADSAGEALIMLCCTLGFLALSYASQAPNVFDLAPQYAHVLFSVMNTFGSLPGIVGVALTGILVDATQSYAAAFGVAGILAWLGGAVYLWMGSGRLLLR